jgi:putative transposase
MKEEYAAEFCEEAFFHIYNRTNNKELLFLSDEDRIIFMKRYEYYLSNFVETFCWCLLPNHFHFLIRIKSREDICVHLSRISQEDLKEIEIKFLKGEESMENLITLEWDRFLVSYAMRFNKRHNRSGNLFYRTFKRVSVASKEQFQDVILYIHTNPCKHWISNEIETYAWSSFRSLIVPDIENSVQEKIMTVFNGIEHFKLAHSDKLADIVNGR